MTQQDNKDKQIKRDFFLTKFSLKNINTIFLVAISVVLFGVMSYIGMPKELFPEVSFPTILVQTVYPGNPPSDIENLITRPLEKELQTVKGATEVSSISSQDASMIFVEFNTDMDIKMALKDVKDAIDKAMAELPNDLPSDPMAVDIDPSQFPIININLSGDFSLEELKEYAEYLDDEIEQIYEVSKADIKGLNDREIHINVDPHKLDAFQMTFRDIENAIANENISMSGGELRMGDLRRAVRVIGEFTSVAEMSNIIVKHEKGNIVYLRDVAQVVDGYADPESFARLDGEPVVSLQVIKKGGENLLNTADQIFEILKKAKENNTLPENLTISITNDQSKDIIAQIDNLENSMIISIIFVVGVLFFFLGMRNAFLVGAAIPMSMLISFTVLSLMGTPLNMIVLFGLILALGMLVDNAIVVVENIYRFIDKGYSVKDAARYGTGEIAVPIIVSTATTLAAFIPLAFWDGLIGEFMGYLPITLIIVLSSSLFVALILVPVFATAFIKKEQLGQPLNKKNQFITIGIMAAVATVLYIMGAMVLANLIALFAILGLMNVLFLFDISIWFQNTFLVWLENVYLKMVEVILKGNRPTMIFVGSILLLIGTVMFMGGRGLKVEFFPNGQPKYINVLAELPIGTDVEATDRIYREIEQDIYDFAQGYGDVVESVLTTVGNGAKRRMEMSASKTPNRAMTTIKFVDYKDRNGVNTSDVMRELSLALTDKYPGVEIFVEKDANGPPTGNPINVEVTGKEIDELFALTDKMISEIESANIAGIEGLKIDIDLGKPELLMHIDREKARRFGLSTIQIASTIRTSLFGKEISDFKVGEDEYPIQLRLQEQYRYNVASLLNQNITFRNTRGKMQQVPISAVATVAFSSSYGSVRRMDMNRAITIYSNVVEGYNANEINADITNVLAAMQMPEGYKYEFTGEQQEQAESMAFLMRAMMIAVVVILIILVGQFNSFIKPMVIIASVLFSTIGVFGGLATFKMNIVVIMTGIGIISLAGVVVNNAIVLVDYIDFLKRQRKKDLGLVETANLPIDDIRQAIVTGGKTRLRPVLLTAITTVLGLLPMAIGLNINFKRLFSEFKPELFIGGDNATFWGPMAWTVIFGLVFATFLTLFIVPAMYLMANQVKLWAVSLRKKKTQGVVSE